MKWRVCSSRHCWNEWTTTTITTTTVSSVSRHQSVDHVSFLFLLSRHMTNDVTWCQEGVATCTVGVSIFRELKGHPGGVGGRNIRKDKVSFKPPLALTSHPVWSEAPPSSSSSHLPLPLPASGTSAQIVFCKKISIKGWNAAACFLASSFHLLVSEAAVLHSDH